MSQLATKRLGPDHTERWKQPTIYVAGPFSQPQPFENVAKACKWADRIMDLGGVPFIPHLTGFWGLLHPRPYDEWLDYDIVWLSRSDALFRFDGYSPGADREVKVAYDLGIPVFSSLVGLSNWMGNVYLKLSAPPDNEEPHHPRIELRKTRVPFSTCSREGIDPADV